MATRPSLPTRDLTAEDFSEVVRIDAMHTGRAQAEYWEHIFAAFLATNGLTTAGLSAERRPPPFGLVVEAKGGGLAGYLFGEVRAVEFGASPCGWVFAIGVDAAWLRRGVAASLLARACERFREAGVERARTLVRRTDVPVLSFFRAHGFEGGPYVQLDMDLEGN